MTRPFSRAWDEVVDPLVEREPRFRPLAAEADSHSAAPRTDCDRDKVRKSEGQITST